MSYLKFYKIEQQLFKQAYNLKLNSFLINKIFNKLVHHYDLKFARLQFKSGKSTKGTCSYNRKGWNNEGCWTKITTIKVNKNCTLGVLVHEIGHALELHRYKETAHTKRLMRLIKSIHRYVESNASINDDVLTYNESLNNENTFIVDLNDTESVVEACINGGN